VGEGGAAGSREPFVSTGAGKWFPAVVWQKSWRERTLPVVPRQIPSSPPPYSRTDHLPFGGCAVELSNVCLTRSPVASLNASFDRSADNAPSAFHRENIPFPIRVRGSPAISRGISRRPPADRGG